jgi:uncharacterized protein (TIGR03067 family)
VHYNASPDGRHFGGDGGGPRSVAAPGNGQFLYLFTPQNGMLQAEKLVDLTRHDYRLEPNVTFTPNGRWIVFRSNLHGPAHVYAVEVAKTETASAQAERPKSENGTDAIKKDMALLEGEWSMVSGEADGTPLPPQFLKDSRRVVKDGVTTVHLGGQLFMKARFRLDPTRKPKTIDYDMLEGATKGQKQLGIYEIDGERVRFCFAAPGQERPTEFQGGKGIALSVWQRNKKVP